MRGGMPQPNVPHRYQDDKRKITFIVVAYRHLSDEEVKREVDNFIRVAGKMLKPGRTIQIPSKLGLRDP